MRLRNEVFLSRVQEARLSFDCSAAGDDDDDCAAKERSRTPNIARKRVVMAMGPRSESFDDISRLSGMTDDKYRYKGPMRAPMRTKN